MFSAPDASGPVRPRIRPHILQAAAGATAVVLDFDGVMFDVLTAVGRDAREDAISELLRSRPNRPRPLPISFAMYGVFRTLALLSEREPDHAVDAEARVSQLELDAALQARTTTGLLDLLAACASAGRPVAVISDLSEPAVLATLQTHRISSRVAAVAARQGLDLDGALTDHAVARVAGALGLDPSACLVVSGSLGVLCAAQRAGAIILGCECGRDRRKRLAGVGTPVVTGLAQLRQALLI